MLKSEKGVVEFCGEEHEIITDYVVLTHAIYDSLKQESPTLNEDEIKDVMLNLVTLAMLPEDELLDAMADVDEKEPF